MTDSEVTVDRDGEWTVADGSEEAFCEIEVEVEDSSGETAI